MRKRYEDMLFNYETCSRTDFRHGEIKPIIKTEYKPKPERIRPTHIPPKYVHTMMEWKKTLPFNSYIKLRDILQTNPHNEQKPYHKRVDHEREEVQRTRPRLVMTPAVSLDDIPPEAREILIKSTYISQTTASLEEAITPYESVKSPLPGLPAPANPITLPRFVPPYVPKEWRMDSVKWDQRQLRSYVNPTREFWKMPEHAPTRCIPCEASKVVESQRKMQREIQQAKH